MQCIILFFCSVSRSPSHAREEKRWIDRAGINSDMVGAGFRVGEAHKEEVATEAKQNGGIIVKQAKKGKGLTEPSGTVEKTFFRWYQSVPVSSSGI